MPILASLPFSLGPSLTLDRILKAATAKEMQLLKAMEATSTATGEHGPIAYRSGDR